MKAGMTSGGQKLPQGIKALLVASAITSAAMVAPDGLAYEVWIGTHTVPQNAAINPDTWSKTAARVSGVNFVRATCKPSPGTPPYLAGDSSCTDAQWRTVIAQFANRQNGLKEIARSQLAQANPDIGAFVESLFTSAATNGYGIKMIMFYDNEWNSVLYEWTTAEVQQMRDYLDSTGRADIELLFDVRNNSQRARDWSSSSLVDHILLEASPTLWFTDVGKRQTMLQWLWSNATTQTKKLYFQITAGNYDNGEDPYGPVNAYMNTRRLVQWLGGTLMGWDFNRSTRVIFMPVTYNEPTLSFYPEMKDGNPGSYDNTVTSETLSLIEQRNLFEARTLAPTRADADSLKRYSGTRPSLAGYWSCDDNTGTTVTGAYGGADGTLTSTATSPAGARWAVPENSYKDGSIYLDGVDGRVVMPSTQYAGVTNNFTMMVWVRPTTTRSGTAGASGQRYAIFPTHGNGFNLGNAHVGVGISVGTNGVGVYEHASSYIPQKISYTASISSTSWTHVAVTYTAGVPRLYINGTLVATGTASTGRIAHPSCWGGSSYGWYKGYLDEMRVYKTALTAQQIIDIIKIES